MSTPRRTKIAQRIELLLKQELGQGLNIQRMLTEPRYERDVLLVCDTYVGRELAAQAQAFRAASAAAAESGHDSGRDSVGFSASRFLSSIFGPPSTISPPLDDGARPPARSWFGRARRRDSGKDTGTGTGHGHGHGRK